MVWMFIQTGCTSKPVDKPLPNILILYADDMGYGDLHIQNPDSKIPTPNLDQLALEGIRFTDGHSSSGICTPSRYGLLTGRHHWRDFHGIVQAMGPPAFKKNQFTLAKLLKNKGYATACIGKWHLGWDWKAIIKPEWRDSSLKVLPPEAYDWTRSIPGGPLDRGFDYYFGDGTINFPPYAFVENDKVIEIPSYTMTTPEGLALEGNWEARPGPAVDGWDFYKVLPTLTRKAVDYVKRQKDADKPFFLYMPFPSPHAPIIPNEEFRGKSQAGAYGDFVFQTDWSAGEILKALDEIGEKDNTLVIFTSDNGPERYAYDRIRNFDHFSMGDFRGLKRDVYEGGHHVPFLVRWPEKIRPGQVNHEVISQVDILKTIAGLIDAQVPDSLTHDSHDFSNLWLGEEYVSPIRKATVQNTYKNRYALRMGDWVFINDSTGYHSKIPNWAKEHLGFAPLSQPFQLYNLQEDIGQKNNRISEEGLQDLVGSMKAKLKEIRSKETFMGN